MGSWSYPHKPSHKCGKDKNESGDEPNMDALSFWTNCNIMMNGEIWEKNNSTVDHCDMFCNTIVYRIRLGDKRTYDVSSMSPSVEANLDMVKPGTARSGYCKSSHICVSLCASEVRCYLWSWRIAKLSLVLMILGLTKNGMYVYDV